MKGRVKSSLLLLSGDAESNSLVQELKNHVRNNSTPSQTAYNAIDLESELHSVSTVEDSKCLRRAQNIRIPESVVLVCGKESSEDSTGDSTNGVYAECIKSVIETEALLELSAEIAHWAGDEADEESTSRIHEATGRGDGDKASDGTRKDAQYGGLFSDAPFSKQPHESSSGGGELGVEHGDASDHAGSYGRPSVESVPADPKERCTEEGKEDVVRLKSLLAEALAVADDDSGHETSDTRRNVNDVASRKIHVTGPGEESVLVPVPVSDGAVHTNVPQDHEDKHWAEFHAVGE